MRIRFRLLILSCMPKMATSSGDISICQWGVRLNQSERKCIIIADLLSSDDSASSLDVGERLGRRQDGLTHALLVDLTVCLPRFSVGCVEYKPA